MNKSVKLNTDRLKELIKANGTNVSGLAIAANVDRKTVASALSGKPIWEQKANLLALHLKVRLCDLLLTRQEICRSAHKLSLCRLNVEQLILAARPEYFDDYRVETSAHFDAVPDGYAQHARDIRQFLLDYAGLKQAPEDIDRHWAAERIRPAVKALDGLGVTILAGQYSHHRFSPGAMAFPIDNLDVGIVSNVLRLAFVKGGWKSHSVVVDRGDQNLLNNQDALDRQNESEMRSLGIEEMTVTPHWVGPGHSSSLLGG